MKEAQSALFFGRLYDKKAHFPFTGQIELTYRCNLDCIHCYCKGLEQRELTTEEWKKILNILQEVGCVYLCFTVRSLKIKDFLEIYLMPEPKALL